jgi:hypothetical protein
MIRMDILKGSRAFDRGSVGVYLGGDKVVGHRGGLLKNLILTLPKESALATTIRGTTFEDSDLFALFRKLIFLNENGVITVTQRDGYFILECVPFDPEINENITKDVVWIESETLLILRNERFEQHELVQETHWSKYILNAGLPDELFDVRFDVGELRKDNIPLIDQEM